MAGAIGQFFLNAGSEGDPVESPAFSITKVLSSASLVLVPVVTLLVDKLNGGDISFSASNYAALVLGVLAFLAIASSADVLARAIATKSVTRSDAILLKEPLTAHLIKASKTAPDDMIKIFAIQPGTPPSFLVQIDGSNSVKWVAQEKVALPK